MNKSKKLHLKHIDSGFLYCSRTNPKAHKMVTKLSETNPLHCEVFDFETQRYYKAIRKAILAGIRNETLISLMGDKYHV